MPCHIVVGGQFGSEGKGKVAVLLARHMEAPFVVRCGGPNSGHTVTLGSEEIVLRQVPTAVICPDAVLLLPAASAVNEEVLMREIALFNIPRSRLVVDPQAIIISSNDELSERSTLADIASTCAGVGAALIRRVQRTPDVRFARDSDALRDICRIEPVAPLLHARLENNRDVLLDLKKA